MSPTLWVTVYIPTRNRAALVCEAINSVLDQTYPWIELFIVDDASDDDTEKVVSKIIEEYSGTKCIRYHRLETMQGACAARNFAILNAKGEYITGLDDDDLFMPKRVECFVNDSIALESAFLFSSYVNEWYKNDGSFNKKCEVKLDGLATLDSILKENLVGNQIFALRKNFIQAGLFDVGLPAWQDYDLWIRMIRKVGVGRPTHRIDYVRRVFRADTSISSSLDKVLSASQIFIRKNPEYSNFIYSSYVKLSLASYGIPCLNFFDLVFFIRSGNLKKFLIALMFLIRNREV